MLFINTSGWIKINEFRYECRKLDIEYPTSREIKKTLLKVGNSAEIFKLTMVERDNIVTLELQKDENFALIENIPEMEDALDSAVNLKDPYSLFVKNGKIEKIEVFTKFFTVTFYFTGNKTDYCISRLIIEKGWILFDYKEDVNIEVLKREKEKLERMIKPEKTSGIITKSEINEMKG